MIKFKTRIWILEIGMGLVALFIATSLYISYSNKQDIVMVNLNQVIGALANDIASDTQDKTAQQAKIQQMVKQLEQHLLDLPAHLTVLNAGSVIKPGKLADYSEQLLAEIRANATK